MHSIEPYTKSELEKTPMPNVIYDFTPRVQGNVTRNPLLYLYPDVDKDVAFGRYYASSGKTRAKFGLLGFGSDVSGEAPMFSNLFCLFVCFLHKVAV